MAKETRDQGFGDLPCISDGSRMSWSRGGGLLSSYPSSPWHQDTGMKSHREIPSSTSVPYRLLTRLILRFKRPPQHGVNALALAAVLGSRLLPFRVRRERLELMIINKSDKSLSCRGIVSFTSHPIWKRSCRLWWPSWACQALKY